MKKLLSAVLALLLLLLSAACSGGKGQTEGSSALSDGLASSDPAGTETPAEDTTPPSVLANTDFADYADQINDGLTETAACANCVAYDKKYGLVFCAYLTGEQCNYGESTGKLMLSVFAPGQPHNIRHVTVDTGVGGSRGLLCNAIYSLGEARVRLLFTVDRGEKPASYYRDYDFLTDTVSERVQILLRAEKGDVPLNSREYYDYIKEKGFSLPKIAPPIINKVTGYNGKLYTAVTLDHVNYPILCTIEDNVLVPFAVCDFLNIYEFRYYIDRTGIHGVYRYPEDDTGTGKIGYVVSRDRGKTWKTEIFADAIQSRPDILSYNGKPLIIYNYMSDSSTENFPPMHHHRNAIRMIYNGKVILDTFSKYGIVEHETLSICGDLYMVFSNCEQALMYQNDKMWTEDGIQVENAKEKANWIKLGYLTGQNPLS